MTKKEMTIKESAELVKAIPADQPINEVFWFNREDSENDTEGSDVETDSN